ncbi:MAG: hypothetical protein HYZ39_23905 [Mycolicibacterium cosmeticum]|nr:hypothetical protein [Mycolicibacterium cosmeticum]
MAQTIQGRTAAASLWEQADMICPVISSQNDGTIHQLISGEFAHEAANAFAESWLSLTALVSFVAAAIEFAQLRHVIIDSRGSDVLPIDIRSVLPGAG